MTTAASTIIKSAHTTLSDPDGVRWPASELAEYLNEAQRELVRLRPDSNSTVSTVTCALGHRQTIPETGMALMDVICNSGGDMLPISKVDMHHLDVVSPGWRSKTASHTIKHFMVDPREPRAFFVYPPATMAARVDVLHSVTPTPVSASGSPASSTTGNLSVQDVWADCLTNYVLFRAYSKDVEFGGNSQVAAAFLTLFNNAAGAGAPQQTAAAA